MKKKLNPFILFALVAFIALLYIWKNYAPESNVRTGRFLTMSTTAQYLFEGDARDSAFDMLKVAFVDCERHCNIFNPKSEVSRLNASAFNTPFHCSDYLFKLLLKAQEYYLLSEGCFDITARPLMQLWGFHRKREQLPSQAEIDSALRIVGFNKLILNPADSSIRFTVEGMGLDFGAIAKGYALDCAIDAMTSLTLSRIVIDLGGNIRAWDINHHGIEIFVRDPNDVDHVLAKTVLLKNEAVAVSGNYFRFVTIENKCYAHIMNPKTARPVEGVLSVFVRAKTAVDADAASTAIFVGGRTIAEKLKKNQKILDFSIDIPSQ